MRASIKNPLEYSKIVSVLNSIRQCLNSEMSEIDFQTSLGELRDSLNLKIDSLLIANQQHNNNSCENEYVELTVQDIKPGSIYIHKNKRTLYSVLEFIDLRKEGGWIRAVLYTDIKFKQRYCTSIEDFVNRFSTYK